jgi:DNA invertase Pin-like site-specific DNA recombinase
MELTFIKDRQRAGIEAARAEGVYKGRKKNIDDDEIRRRITAGDVTPSFTPAGIRAGRLFCA